MACRRALTASWMITPPAQSKNCAYTGSSLGWDFQATVQNRDALQTLRQIAVALHRANRHWPTSAVLPSLPGRVAAAVQETHLRAGARRRTAHVRRVSYPPSAANSSSVHPLGCSSIGRVTSRLKDVTAKTLRRSMGMIPAHRRAVRHRATPATPVPVGRARKCLVRWVLSMPFRSRRHAVMTNLSELGSRFHPGRTVL